MKKIVLSGVFHKDDLQYVDGKEHIDMVCYPYSLPAETHKAFLEDCRHADLIIFQAVGRLPGQIIEDFSKAGLLEQFTRLSCPKVFWSQDSHHAHPAEAQAQKYFDRYYIAHANYLDKFDKERTRYLPCCYLLHSLEKLCALNSIDINIEYDLSSFYVQYNIGSDRNIIMYKARMIAEKSNLRTLFGKLYGSIKNIGYYDMVLGIKRSDIIFNVSLMDDLNLRNFEAIALNKKLLTNKVYDHDIIDLNFENTFFYKRDLSDFEDCLMDAIKHGGGTSQRSVLNKHMLIHRYIEMINKELGTNFQVNTSKIDFHNKTAPLDELRYGSYTDATQIYSHEEMFAHAFLQASDAGWNFLDIYALYQSYKHRLDPEKVCAHLHTLNAKAKNQGTYLINLISFMNILGKCNNALNVLTKYHHDNLYPDFIATFSGNPLIISDVELSQYNKCIFDTAIHALGILNYENDTVSGELHFIKNILCCNDSSIIFDVGANKGSYAALIKDTHPNTKVYAFEPNPTSYAVLKQCARAKNFFCFNIGLSSGVGEAILYDRLDDGGSQHASLYAEVISHIHKTDAVDTKIELSTVDDMMKKIGIEYIDLLKIDTEGHELEVLRGAQEALAKRRIKIIHFEFNEMNVVSRVFMKDFYDALPDFIFYRLLPNGLLPLGDYKPLTHELFAFQNIVAMQKSYADNI